MKTKILGILLLLVVFGCKKEDQKTISKEPTPIEVNDTVSSEFKEGNVEGWNGFPKSGNTIQDFIKNSEYEIVNEIYGDITNDYRKDVVLITRLKNDKTDPRTLVVLIKKGKSYVLAGVNQTLMGAEYSKDKYKINNAEEITIKNQQLTIKIYCQGPCGNVTTTFSYANDKLALSHFNTYNMGAGEHLETDYVALSKIATVTATNTMEENSPTQTDKTKLNYQNPIDFSNFNAEDLSEAILKNTKVEF
jgi:hypothetical protein